LCDQLTVAEAAESRNPRDQVTADGATNLPWITLGIDLLIHRVPSEEGATNLPWAPLSGIRAISKIAWRDQLTVALLSDGEIAGGRHA
jgi:hypothetical protein